MVEVSTCQCFNPFPHTTIQQQTTLNILSNFFFCHYVVTESVYMRKRVNPFPHTDASLQQTTFENIVTKGGISTHFNNLTFIYSGLPDFCQGGFKVVCCSFAVCGKGLNPFLHTTNLQQTTLKTFSQKHGLSL